MSLTPKAKPFARFLWRVRKTAILRSAFPKRERDAESGPMSDQALARAMQQISRSPFAADRAKNTARRSEKQISSTLFSWLRSTRKSQDENSSPLQ